MGSKEVSLLQISGERGYALVALWVKNCFANPKKTLKKFSIYPINIIEILDLPVFFMIKL